MSSVFQYPARAPAMRQDQLTAATTVHQYGAGARVHLIKGFPYRKAVAGDYEVLSQLPSRDGEFQYRIKSCGEPYERVVKESELEQA